ncbi:tyrosine-type recombinase/integrase [Peribacillus castrilensis]|uniref:Integrase/recombinase n=1 Tax=Peribacillus simplex TaxID=1478 RepID=A0AAN2PJT7_9BACI|nr:MULTISPECIES: site-specific integrase [Bacillaceae]MBD8586411.1 site-specific integrase [Peribacillus simplex]MCF7623782.1 site-specific integrase [Peribacillus frigoritolerans]MCP1154328.1 site-specific integrase [Peribacillus frigoritolerans]MCT1390851.1 site-specific integrase [Peribacillus frigoritolerans]MEA3573735.1 site-specific integrase [Peribacillus frigoritolerans]
MTKRKGLLDVKVDVRGLLEELPVSNSAASKARTEQPAILSDSILISNALDVITRQMKVSGNRSRTISDYVLHVEHFQRVTNVADITANTIYKCLDSMNVSNQTKLTRLKCLKAFLSRCFDNRWIEMKFWKTINIKVDQKVKEGATEHDVNVLLSLLDLGNFIHLRDAVAVLVMFKTGIRINTLVQLEERHIDLNNNVLNLEGSIMKNHQQIKLPFDDFLKKLLEVLLKQNAIIRTEYGKKNSLIFITKYGDVISTSPTHNNIQKRLNKYSRMYGLKNINPHALRRGFAKTLLNKGANVAVISKALGHSDISVTTKYLHLDIDEVVNNLRSYL